MQDTSAREDFEHEDVLPAQPMSLDANLGRRVDEVSQEVVEATTTLGQLVRDAAQLTSVADTEEQNAAVAVREGDDGLKDVAFLVSAVGELLLVLKVRTLALSRQEAQLGNGVSG